MTPLEKHLISLQQKLEHLNAEVANLIALTSSTQKITAEFTNTKVRPSVSTPSTYSKKSLVGINRYRQLQANE